MFDLPPDLTPPNAPDLNVDALPTGDQSRGRSVERYLGDLHQHSRRYTEAHMLGRFAGSLTYLWAKGEPDSVMDTALPGWFHISGQAAALSARNYWKTLEGLEGLPGSIPSWRDLVDMAALKMAKRDFERRFPKADRVRHSIAHPEFYSNPNMVMMPNGPMEPSEPYAGYWATFEGELVQCEVTEDAAKFMAENAARVFAAFDKLRRPAT